MPRKRPGKRRKLSKQKLCACMIKKQKYLSSKENLEGAVSFDQDTKTNIVVKSEEDLNKIENIKFESSHDSLSDMVENKLEFLCDEKEKSKILAKYQDTEQVNQNSGILSLTPFSDTIKNSISENMNNKNRLETKRKRNNLKVEFEKNIKHENIFFEKIPLVELRQLSEADLRKWSGTKKSPYQKQESEKSLTNVTKNNMAPKQFERKQVIHTEQVTHLNVFKENNNTSASNTHSVRKLLRRDYNYRIPQVKNFRKKCFKFECDLVTFRAKSSDPIFKLYKLVSGGQLELCDKEKANEPSKILRLGGHPTKSLSKELLKRLGSRGSSCERAKDDVQQSNQGTVGKDNIKSVAAPFSKINKESQPYKQPISISCWSGAKPISKECTVLDRGKRQECYHPQENNQETDTPVNTTQQTLTQLNNSISKPSEATVSHVFISPATIKRPPSRPKHNLKKSIGAFSLSCVSSVSEMSRNDNRNTAESWRENDCLSLYAESLSESLVNNVSTKNYEETTMNDFTSEESTEYGRIDINSWIENNPVGRSLSPEQPNINDSNNYDKTESFNLRDRNEHTDSRAAHVQKNGPINMNNKNENCANRKANKYSFNKQWKSSTDLTCNLFYNVCPQIKIQNKCSLRNCRYAHNWPCDWKNKMLGMQKDDVMHIYNSAKAGSEIHLLKMILTVVLKQLATARDLNNIFLLTQDIITTDLNSDRQPYIKTVIEYLCECGFEYYMVVDLIFTCTSLEKNLKELLADILLTLTVENKQLYDSWNTVRKLCKYKEYDLDNGVVQSILRQTFETSDLDERLCRAVYNDLIKPLADVKPIPTKILLLCVQGLEKIGLKSESQFLNAKIDHFKSKRSTPENDSVANNCSLLESVYRNSSTYFHPSSNESRQSGSPSPLDSRVSAPDQQIASCSSQVSPRTIASKAHLHAPGVPQVPSKIPRLSASETRVSITDSHKSADAPKLFTAESIFVSPVRRIPATKSRVSTTGLQEHAQGSQASTSGPPMSTGELLFPPPFWKETDSKEQVSTTDQQEYTHGLQASVSGSRMSTAEHFFPRPARRIPDSKSTVPTAGPQQAVHGPRVPVSGPRMPTAEHLFPPPVRPIPDSKSTASTTSPQEPAHGSRVSGPRRRIRETLFPPPFRKLSDSKSVVPTTDPHQPAHGPRVPVSGPRMSAAKHLFPPPVRRVHESTVSNTDSQEPARGSPELVSGLGVSTAKYLFSPPVRRIPESTISNTNSQNPDRGPPELVAGPGVPTAKYLFPPSVLRISDSKSAVPSTGPQQAVHGLREPASGSRISSAENQFPPPVHRLPNSPQERDHSRREPVSDSRKSPAEHLFTSPVRRIPESTVSSTDSQKPARGPREPASGPRMATAEHLFPPLVRRIPESTVSSANPQESTHSAREPVSGPSLPTENPLFSFPSLRAPVSGPSESPTAPHEFGVDEMGSPPRTSTPNSPLSEQLDEPVIDSENDILDEHMKHEDNTILKTDIQRAVFTSELSTILSYVERYDVPDRLVLSCIEALREILFAVPQFYQNLHKKASDIKEKNGKVQSFLKTLGVNLVLLLWRSSDWNSAFEVLKDFNTQFQYYCKDVKSLLPESSSILKTSIVFCDIYLKKMYIQNAWNVLKANILDSNAFDDCNPADLKYAEAVLKLFMEKLCTPTWSYYGIQVVFHFIKYDFKLIDVGQYIDKIFTLSVNENCPMDNIRNFMRMTNWYNNISELTFRALVVHARKNSEKLLYFKLLETGMDLTIYPKIFGNEDVFEISVQYAYEEVIVLLEYLFVNMVRYMPRQNILLIKVRDRIDRVYDFDEPTANCISIQQDFPPKQMLARVVNILQNTFQIDITYHEQSNSVCIEKEQLMLHLLRVRSSLIP